MKRNLFALLITAAMLFCSCAANDSSKESIDEHLETSDLVISNSSDSTGEPTTIPSATTTPESTIKDTTSESETITATDAQTESVTTEVSKEETVKATAASSYPELQEAEIKDANGKNLTWRDYDSYFYTGDDISFTVLQDTLTDTSIEYTLVNDFGMLETGVAWVIQKKIDGQWYNLNSLQEAYELEALIIPIETRTRTFDFGKYYGSLEPGDYRVIFSATTEPDESSENRYGYIFLSSEFTVS